MHEIYLPLIRHWLGRLSVAPSDIDDLAQEVWLVVLRRLSDFERRRDGSFRAWLRQLAVNIVRNWRRKHPGAAMGDAALAQLEDPNSDLSQQWDRDHDQTVFQNLLQIVRPDFASTSWTAFQQFALDGKPAAAVAENLGISEAAVLQAKARILRRLRTEAAGLIE